MAFIKKQNKSGKRGRILPLSKEEQHFVYQYCEDNLLNTTDAIASELALILDRDYGTIKTHMWHKGYRPRQEVIAQNLVERIHKQFLKDEGLEFLYEDEPVMSDALEKLIEKLKTNHK